MHTTKATVRYGETDRLGGVYYGNYALYFEDARLSFLESLKIDYKSLEESGIAMPVTGFTCRYLNPLHFGDEIVITTLIKGDGRRLLSFHHEIFKGALLCTNASVSVAFMNMETGRGCKCPEEILKKLEHALR